jgi:hypothetical protein
MTKFEAVLFFSDLITIFARKTLHSRPIRQVATSVIAILLTHYPFRFNRN